MEITLVVLAIFLILAVVMTVAQVRLFKMANDISRICQSAESISTGVDQILKKMAIEKESEKK